jgi:hypothetical protein
VARLFNGTTDFIQMGGTVRGNDLLGVMACAWVNVTALGGTRKVMGRWDTGVTEQWVIQIDPGGTVTVGTLDTANAGHTATTVATVTPGVWTHVGILAINNNTLRAYINGAQNGTTTNPLVLKIASVETQPCFIGKSAAAGSFFNGAIAECVMTVANIALGTVALYELCIAMMAAGAGAYQGTAPIQLSELIRYYPLLGDTTEADYAGHRVTSTITGTTVVNHPPVRSLSLGLAGSARAG